MPAEVAADPQNRLTLELSTGGTVVIQLRPDLAPGHVERIRRWPSSGFYNGIIFHRVIPGFMAQTGDPKGTGEGGSKLPDLKAEFNALPHLRGTVSMARATAEDSANSQFFIMFAPRFALDHKYTAFGRVIEGMAAVDADRASASRRPNRPRSSRRSIGTASAAAARPAATPAAASRSARDPVRRLMRVDLFDFDLPADRIALRPARPRDSARLLLVEGDALADRAVTDLPQLLRRGDVLVFNDTKVIPAQLEGTRGEAQHRRDAAQARGAAPLVGVRPQRQAAACRATASSSAQAWPRRPSRTRRRRRVPAALPRR